MPKHKTYELEKCECGHTVPIDFVVRDKENNGTCAKCHIDYISDLLETEKRKNKSLRLKLKLLKQKPLATITKIDCKHKWEENLTQFVCRQCGAAKNKECDHKWFHHPDVKTQYFCKKCYATKENKNPIF